MKKFRKLNLQFFAEGGEGGNGDQNTGTQQQQNQQNQSQNTGIDYEKIQSMLDTATQKKENAVLKSYFQQQGLSEEEVSQAIASFKATKQQQSQQQQDTTQLQTQITEAQKVAEQAQIELEATKVAMTLGIDVNTLPYVLKMADLSGIKDKEGKINADNVKAALNKVLEDVPQLKPQKTENKGFQIGGGTQQQQQTTTQPTAQKRWNRFNN